MSNRLNGNLLVFAVEAFPDPCSKSGDDDDLFSVGAGLEIWVFLVQFCVCFPVSPIFFSCPRILCHNAISNCSPRRHDITFEEIFEGRWNSFQEVVCSGNRDEKTVMKGLLAEVNFVSEKDLDAISAI